MARRNVFICYHREDQEFLDQLRIRLDPLGRQDRLKIWTDREIPAGAEPEVEISRSIANADAAIVLVSPDLLASDPIRDQQLQRLMQAREDQRLILLPLYLRHVNTGHARFTVDSDEGPREIDLTRIKGLNDRQAPLAPLARAKRDQALADAAKALDRVLERLPSPSTRSARPRRELTVVLELRGKHVARRYGQAPYYDLYASRGHVDLERFESLKEQSLEELGRKLLELLLGPKSERQEILSKAYRREFSDPLRHAFRIRIRTKDRALQVLPWPLCRWRQHLLIDEGWSFELATSDEPRPIEHLHTPCRALLVAAECADRSELLADAHARSFESLLTRAWDHPLKARLVHRARTSSEVEAELRSPVDLLYIYAHAELDGSRLVLRLEDGDLLPIERLAEMMIRRPPRIVVLNTVGICPMTAPLPGVAVTVHLRREEDNKRQRDARAAAAAWWQAVLGTGLDPVQAFRELPEEVRSRGAIFTDYREWQVDHSDQAPKIDRPRAHLDRRDQRRVVLDAVQDLAHGRWQRVTCIVAYGAEGNLVEHFAVQVLATLKERGRNLARLMHTHLELPSERRGLTRAAIAEHFLDTLGLQPSDTLAAAFHRQRRGGPRARPVYFFDWGTYGDGHRPPLVSGDLESWILFCRDELEAACPPNARVLGYISLVNDQDRHRDLVRVVKALKKRHYQPHFDLIALPALGTVTAEDLLRFLAESGNSSCPPALLEDLPERIIQETGGSFEKTVELLEETERSNRWFELTEELAQATPEPDFDRDIPL